jgi:hypothetical protein
MLQPKEYRIGLTGEGFDDRERAEVVVRFHDPEFDCYPSVKVECFVRSEPSESVENARMEAAAEAARTLRSAADYLDSCLKTLGR